MLRFFQRPYPSANTILLEGPEPILVDSGFGSDVPTLLEWLGETAPALIVNTHAHSDHAGGNHALQRRFGTPIAASAAEAAQIAAGDPDAGDRRWLAQPIAPYTVATALRDGDLLDTGAHLWRVLATPGHVPGHLSLHHEQAGILVLGDALHQADVGWLSLHRPEALAQTEATLARLAGLGASRGYSGHGPAVLDMVAALDRARRRVAGWRRDRSEVGWHACKRIFAHALMLEDGLAQSEIEPFLLQCPWFLDHAALLFDVEPATFVGLLLTEMLRADAAYWRQNRLLARAAYRAPPPGWAEALTPLRA